jgi:hypothetical protein
MTINGTSRGMTHTFTETQLLDLLAKIADLEMVRAALMAVGFTREKPDDDWIRYWLNTGASLERIVNMAIGKPDAACPTCQRLDEHADGCAADRPWAV